MHARSTLPMLVCSICTCALMAFPPLSLATNADDGTTDDAATNSGGGYEAEFSAVSSFAEDRRCNIGTGMSC